MSSGGAEGGNLIGFLKFMLQVAGNFLGLLIGIVGFIWVIGCIGGGDWISALFGVPVLLLGAWMNFSDYGNK